MWYGNVIPDGMGMTYLCGMGIPYQMEWEYHTRWNGNDIPMWYGNGIPMWYGNTIPDGMGVPYHIGMIGMESYHTIIKTYHSHTIP